MIDNLLVVRSNRYGLTRDATIFARVLSKTQNHSEIVDTRGRSFLARLLRKKIARRAFHFERAHRLWFTAAAEHVLIPNPEHFPERHLKRLRRIKRVFAKTRHAERLFTQLGVPTTYTGFMSEDCYDASVPKRWDRFFHLAGASVAKATEDVIDLWCQHPEWPELTIVQKEKHAPKHLPHNIRLCAGYADPAALRHLQNSCGIHLCPSRAEGWGHYIVEALSCGAVVVTTDAPPMNEHVTPACGILVPYTHTEPRNLGTYYYADKAALETSIQQLIVMADHEKAQLGQRARQRYELICKNFFERMHEALTRSAS